MTSYSTLSQSYSGSFFIYKIAICIYRFIFEVLRGTYSGFIFEINLRDLLRDSGFNYEIFIYELYSEYLK